MLGLSGDESILAAQAAGSSFPGAGSWVCRAFGHSMFSWVQNDPGSVGPWRRWALKVHGEHKALGALSLLHYYQQLCCGECESAGPRFHVASHKFAAVFGFGNVSRAKSSFPSRCLKVFGGTQHRTNAHRCSLHRLSPKSLPRNLRLERAALS